MSARAPTTPPANSPAKPRSRAAQDRLAAALRDNLKRRKAQERAREAAPPPPPKKDP